MLTFVSVVLMVSYIFVEATAMTLGLIGRDGGLSALFRTCGFACQQMMLKMVPSPGYLHSEDGVV